MHEGFLLEWCRLTFVIPSGFFPDRSANFIFVFFVQPLSKTIIIISPYFFSVFFSLLYNSRRRSPRPSSTWIVLWKCRRRRKWRATRSAWLWLPPIVSTFSTSREESKWWFDILSMFPRTNMKVYATYIMMGNRPCDWLFSFFFFFFRPDVIKETSPSPEAKPRLLSRRNSNISNTSSRRHPTHLA